MSVVARADAFQRRHPRVAFPLAVVYKYVDDHGGYLAALITFYTFVGLFPLLLLLSTVLGLVLAGHPDLQLKVLHSALNTFPVIGPQLHDPKHLGGGASGLIIGTAGGLYGGLGAVQAVQHAMNTAWHVPHDARPNPLAARGRSLVLLAALGLSLIVTTVLAALVSGAGSLGGAGRFIAGGASLLINGTVFTFGFRFSAARRLATRQVVPGAVLATIAWQLMQTFGAVYIGRVVRRASEFNSVFALVLGLLAFLYLASVVLVVCVEVNVVRVDCLYPRALLVPFTDHVDMTAGDRRVYTGRAKAQRSKGFQTIRVSFHRGRRGTNREPD